jgi:hypothetical protein
MAELPIPLAPTHSITDEKVIVTAEMLQFLRDEGERNRKSMRDDAELNRKLLKDALQLVAIPLTLLIAVAGFLGFRSVSDLKQGLQGEAKRETKQEVTKMEEQIRTTLDSQFQTENLRRLVSDAAKQATSQSAQPLIKAEVYSQVRMRVAAEEPAIRETVKTETQTAVQDMNNRIQDIVRTDVNSRVSNEIQPVLARLNQAENLHELITRMDSGDALAFDRLVSGDYLEGLTPELRSTAIAAAKRVFQDANSGIFMTRSFNNPLNRDQLLSLLGSAEPDTRQAALDSLVSNQPAYRALAQIEQMAENDPSIAVRRSATRCFNAWTKQAFQLLDKNSLAAWWQANRVRVLNSGQM